VMKFFDLAVVRVVRGKKFIHAFVVGKTYFMRYWHRLFSNSQSVGFLLSHCLCPFFHCSEMNGLEFS